MSTCERDSSKLRVVLLLFNRFTAHRHKRTLASCSAYTCDFTNFLTATLYQSLAFFDLPIFFLITAWLRESLLPGIIQWTRGTMDGGFMEHSTANSSRRTIHLINTRTISPFICS